MGMLLTEWVLHLFDLEKEAMIDDDSGICNVLTADSPAEATIYSDANGTAASNPLTFTNGVVRFFTADTVTSLDVTGQTAKGYGFFKQGITPSDHVIRIDPKKMEHTLVVPYTYNGASETVVDTGFDIYASMLMKDCFVHVTTAGTGFALDVGTSTDTDGFLDGVLVTTTGYPVTAIEEAIVSTSGLLGTLLANATGNYVRKLHKRANATSGANIVYTNTTSSTTAGAGYIYLTYLRVPTI